ncbi:hypothetical protein AGMMS4952_27780 [Spirochaetia bacterium]|nr:hypothetical protein AGMMS4952_27780 [Spirochaetia bacterium]
MANERILIIEDDDTIADLERDFLEINGFETMRESDGVKGMERAISGGFDLILLDLMLPGIDGYAICRAIRDKINVPILMVTARGEEIDKVRGLGLGADDYITKPFTPSELVARIKSHIARFKRITEAAQLITTASKSTYPEGDIVIGDLTINPATRRVFISETVFSKMLIITRRNSTGSILINISRGKTRGMSVSPRRSYSPDNSSMQSSNIVPQFTIRVSA